MKKESNQYARTYHMRAPISPEFRRLRVWFPSGTQKHFPEFVIKLEQQTVYPLNYHVACKSFQIYLLIRYTDISRLLYQQYVCQTYAIWVLVAQWLERLTRDQKIAGSISVWGSETLFWVCDKALVWCL